MNTDADEVKHRTDDVGDEDHQHQWCNGNDEGNWFGLRYLHGPPKITRLKIRPKMRQVKLIRD